MAGLLDIFAISLKADVALRLALGEFKIHLAPFDLNYKGKLIIHSCNYESEQERDLIFKNIEKLGFSPNEIAFNAILGWAKITETKKYTSGLFKQDKDLHEYGDNLDLFKAQEKWNDVFGYLIQENQYLYVPIYGIGEGKRHGDWWTPESPFHVLCWRRALDSQTIDVEKVEV